MVQSTSFGFAQHFKRVTGFASAKEFVTGSRLEGIVGVNGLDAAVAGGLEAAFDLG